MPTDRATLKALKVLEFTPEATSAANANTTIAAIDTRAYCWTKSGNENSSNNVGEVAMFVVNRAGTVRSVKLITNTNVAANATNGMILSVLKHPVSNAASSATVANWNTDPAAQGALVSWTAASFVVVANADATCVAGDVLTFKCTKFGSGSLLDSPSAVVVDIEEN